MLEIGLRREERPRIATVLTLRDIQENDMAAVDEKVKQIIVEQLQVDEAEVTPEQASRRTLAPTLST